MRRASRALLLALPLSLGLLGLGAAHAQLFTDPEWKESPVPPPPAFDAKRALPIEMPVYMNLRFSVDPQTIAITPDGVVRYVIIASRDGADGAVNAFYEGVRCASDEVKIYARYNSNAWQLAFNPEWKLYRAMNSRYSAALASQALCAGHAPRQSVKEMVRNLQTPISSP